MNLQNLFLSILYCKYRALRVGDSSLKSLVKAQNHHELVYIANGHGSITMDHKRYTIRDGTLLYICPDVPHEIEIVSGEHAEIMTVHFNCVSVSFTDGAWVAVPEAKSLPFSIVEYVTENLVIAELFRKLTESWKDKLPGYELAARSYLQELLLAVYSETHRENKNYALGSKIETIIRFMHESIQKQITLSEIARLVQLSPAYLTRSFKEATGYAVIEYFNKIKIDRAKELLIESDGKVRDVAQSIGFGDEFYFSRLFKKITGVSPKEYRRKNVHEV